MMTPFVPLTQPEISAWFPSSERPRIRYVDHVPFSLERTRRDIVISLGGLREPTLTMADGRWWRLMGRPDLRPVDAWITRELETLEVTR